MKDAYTSQVIANILERPVQSIIRTARREGWQSRPRAGRGGGHEWLVSSMPEKTRLALAARICTMQHQPEPFPTSAVSGTAAPAANSPIERPGAPRGAGAATSLLALTGAAKKRAEARVAVVLAARMFTANSGLAHTRALDSFAQCYNAGEISVETWVRETLPQICRSSLMRWDARAREEGAASLAGNYGQHRKGKGLIDSQELVENTILGMFAENPRVSAQLILERLESHVHEGINIEIPSLRRLQAWIADWKAQKKSLALFVTSPDKWTGQYQSATGNAYELITEYNERWEYDGTPADLLLNDDKRYTIVGIINVYSRELKLEVAERSTGRTVANLTRRCLLDWGVPQWAVTDNGKEFVGAYMQGVFLDLGITPHILPPFQPRLKPAIERAFRSFSHHLLTLCPCYVGHNVATRQEIRERETFAKRLMNRGKSEELSMAIGPRELQKFCDEWTDNFYRHRVHSGLKGKLKGMTPWQVRQSWTGEVRRITPEQERGLDVLLMDCGWREITKKGIRFDNLHFDHEALGAHAGQRAQVRVDPTDRTHAWIFREDKEGKLQYLCQAVEVSGMGLEERIQFAREKKRAQMAHITREKRRLDTAAKTTDAKNAARHILDMYRDKARAIEAGTEPAGHRVVAHESPALSGAVEAVNIAEAASPVHGGAVADAARVAAREAMTREEKTSNWLPDTRQKKYEFYCELRERVRRGEEIPPEQREWMEIFSGSNICKGFAMLEPLRRAVNE